MSIGRAAITRRVATLAFVLVLGTAAAATTVGRGGGAIEHLRPSSALSTLRFEPNVGQTDPQVRFLARTANATVFLTGQEAVIRLAPARPRPGALSGDSASLQAAPGRASTVLRVRPVDADLAAPMAGMDRLEGTSNYLIGGDPAGWHTQVPSYGEVRYRNVYPGIDLVYHGGGGGLEYDFVVAPGADPSAIALAFQGQDQMTVEGGELDLDTPAGRVAQPVPHLYQDAGGIRREVPGGYAQSAPDRVSFAVGAYDRSRPLVIDPVLAYSTFLGGTGWDEATAIAVDPHQNAYVEGTTFSTDFPVTPGAAQGSKRSTYIKGSYPPASCPAPDGCRDVFVTKLDPTGSRLVYSTYLGGRSDNGASKGGIAVDSTGAAYVGGTTLSSLADLPGIAKNYIGPQGGPKPGVSNAFVTTLSADGTQALRTTLLGGQTTPNQGIDVHAYNFLDGVAAGRRGDVYLVGSTDATDFPTTIGAFEPKRVCSACGEIVLFLTRIDSTGQLAYSTYIGHAGGVPANLSNLTFDTADAAIAVDPAGDVVIAGGTTAPDYPVTPGAYQTVRPDQASIDAGHNPRAKGVITKLHPVGHGPADLVYSTFLGAPYITDPNDPNGTKPGWFQQDWLDAVALDDSGDIYVGGVSNSPNFPTTPGALQATRVCSQAVSSDCPSPVVAKLHPAGLGPLDLVHSTYLGGPGVGAGGGAITSVSSDEDGAHGIAVGPTGDVFVAGSSTSPGFPVTSSHGTPMRMGSTPSQPYSRVFVTRFDPALSHLVSSATFGGSRYDLGLGEALDASGVYVTGFTTSTDYPVSAAAAQPHLRGVCSVKGDPSSPCPDGFVTKIPLPQVTGVTPDIGPVAGGQRIAVTGRGLADASEVRFGAATPATTVTATPCPSTGGTPLTPCFTQVSDTLLTVYTPPHPPGLVDVTVVTPWGPSDPNPLGTVSAPAGDQYRYDAGSPCIAGSPACPITISSVSPPCVALGGPQQLTITGTGLVGPLVVDLGPGLGEVRGTVEPGGNRLTATAPAASVAGPVQVRVTSNRRQAINLGAVVNFQPSCGPASPQGGGPPSSLLGLHSGAAADSSTPFLSGGYATKVTGLGPFTPSPPGTAPAPVPHSQPVPGSVQVPAPAPGTAPNPGPAPVKEEKQPESAAESSHAMVRVAAPGGAAATAVLVGGCFAAGSLVARRRSARRCCRPAPRWIS